MKDEITIEQVSEDEMTWFEVIKHYWPEVTDEQATEILWNETCHPFDTKMTLKQLFHIYLSNTPPIINND